MTIRKQVQFYGSKYYGLVNKGNNLDSDELTLAKEALDFMIAAINAN